MQSDIPILVYHVTLGMPVLVLAIAKDLNKLLQDRVVATLTSLSKSCGVMVVTVHVALVLVVTVLCSENCRTY